MFFLISRPLASAGISHRTFPTHEGTPLPAQPARALRDVPAQPRGRWQRRMACLAPLAGFFASTLLAADPKSAENPPFLAQSYSWRSVVIGGGGFVSGLVFHPTQRDLLYARTDVGGAYRWDSAEQRWFPLNDSLAAENGQLLGIVSLAVDSGDPQRLYLACGQYLQDWGKPAALLWSSDQGATWGRVPFPFHLGGNADGRSTGERLQVDPHDGNILFLGTNQDGLWRSADQGRTWKRVEKFPGRSLTCVFFDATSGASGKPTPAIYAGVNDVKGAAVFRSTDAGVTWKPLPGQPAGLIVHHAAFDSAHTLFLAYANYLGPNDITGGAVWKFQPAENRWTNITPVAPDAAAQDAFGYAGLTVDAQHAGVVMVSTLDRWSHGDDIFRTIDGGATWKPLRATSTWDSSFAPYTRGLKPHWMGVLTLDPFNSDRALFVTGYGVWATNRATAVDAGAPTPWVFADDGLEETVVEDLVSPPQGAPLVSALADIGGFRHDEPGSSPRAGAHQPPQGNNPSIAFAEREPLKLVRTHSGPARGALSLDGGTTWKDFTSTPPTAKANGPGTIALSADGKRIVWLPKGSAPFFSADDGATWTQSASSFVSARDYKTDIVVADRVSAGNFYFYDINSGSVHGSTDGGVHFSALSKLAADGGALRAMPGRTGHLWAPTPGGLFRSTDAGAHFEKIPEVDSAAQIGFGANVPDGGPPGLFMLGRVHGVPALFRSDDLGASWIAISDALHKFGYLKVIAGDARAPNRVYLGTGGRGIVVGDPR